VLIQYENPLKFKSKWFDPLLITKILLGTYKLQDPNGRELAVLAHGNQLIKAAIHTANELRDIWASLRKREEVRRRNKAELELISSYPENSNTLQKYLFHDEDVPLTQDKTTTNPNPLVQKPDLKNDCTIHRFSKKLSKRPLKQHWLRCSYFRHCNVSGIKHVEALVGGDSRCRVVSGVENNRHKVSPQRRNGTGV
jgi:hypothetical protein